MQTLAELDWNIDVQKYKIAAIFSWKYVEQVHDISETKVDTLFNGNKKKHKDNYYTEIKKMRVVQKT